MLLVLYNLPTSSGGLLLLLASVAFLLQVYRLCQSLMKFAQFVMISDLQLQRQNSCSIHINTAGMYVNSFMLPRCGL